MKRTLLTLCTLAYFLVSSAQTIPPDPEILKGRLDNGLTYYLCRNSNPAGTAEFYIAHNVGALQEEDNQNGLAHFLEHMAFNGTRHYPDKKILEFLADEGVRFGYNVNAYTSKTETVYNLSNVPLVRDSFIDSVLMVLRDWSCDISCEQQALDDERGVISEEWRLGDDSRTRMANQQTKLIYRGAKQAERNVIGTLEVINGFKREEILDFYHKWYRPDLQAIIVVGDFDVDDMEGRIRRLFCDIPASVNPEPKGSYIPPAIEEPVFEDMTDREVRYQAFKLIWRQDNPFKDHSDESYFKDELCRMIVTSVVQDRFRELTQDKACPVQAATLVTNTYRPDMYVSLATLTPRKKENLAECLRFVEREIRRVLLYGISPAEFEIARLNISDRLKLGTELNRDELKSSEIVPMALSNFLNATPLVLPDTFREIRRSILSAITFDDIAPYPSIMFAGSGRIYSNCYNDANEPDIAVSKDKILQIIAEVAAEDIAPAFLEYPKMDLSVSAEPGHILSRKKVSGSDMELWKLSNGASVYYKQAAPVKRGYHLAMNYIFDTGYKVFDADSITSAKYTLSYAKRNTGFGGVGKSGLKNYPELSGIKLMLMGNSRDARLLVTTDSEAVENAFKAAFRQISDPCFDSERLLESSKASSLKSLGKKKTPKDLFETRCERELYGNHPWLQELDSASVQAVSLASVEDAYRRYYGDIPALKVVICSDVPRSEIESLVEKYIASLDVDYPYSKGKYLPAKPVIKERLDVFESTAPISEPLTQISWNLYFNSDRSIRERAAIDILDYIMSARYLDLIREKRGGAYSVQFATTVATEKGLPSHSRVSFQTRPEMRDLLLGDLQDELDSMCKKGPTEQEMEHAVKYLVKHHYEAQEQIARSVGLQLDRMEDFVRFGTPYGYDYEKAVRSLKPCHIRALASRINSGRKAVMVYEEK